MVGGEPRPGKPRHKCQPNSVLILAAPGSRTGQRCPLGTEGKLHWLQDAQADSGPIPGASLGDKLPALTAAVPRRQPISAELAQRAQGPKGPLKAAGCGQSQAPQGRRLRGERRRPALQALGSSLGAITFWC